MTGTQSLHHVTASCSNAERTLDFYTRILGLKLVRTTVSVDNLSILQLYCGDAAGSPGSLITFLVEPNAPIGVPGTGQIGNVVFSIKADAYEYWFDRLGTMGVQVHGYAWSFGERYLCFSDPDGLSLSLASGIGIKGKTTQPAIGRLQAIEIQLQGFEHTARFLTDTLGFEQAGKDGPVTRFMKGPASAPAVIDVVAAPTYRKGSEGVGICNHAAWRVPDQQSLFDLREKVVAFGLDVTPALDRFYFQAIYFDVPGGPKIGIATDGPGFQTDTDAEHLDLPPWLEGRRPRIERNLTTPSRQS